MHVFNSVDKYNLIRLFYEREKLNFCTDVNNLKYFFHLLDTGGVLDMSYKDFGYMYSLFGDLVIFNSDDEAIRLRNVLHNVFRPEEVSRYMGEVEIVSSRLLNSIEDGDIVIPYKMFKQLTTEMCLRLFLGVEMETATREAASIIELTIAHWHGKQTKIKRSKNE